MHSRLERNFASNMEAIQKVSPKLHQNILDASVAHSYELQVVDIHSGLYNIKDTLQNIPIMFDVFTNLKETINEVNRQKENPFIYLYGISNGYILNFLLQNNTHRHICLFEPELELLFTAMHLYDFAHPITTQRLMLIPTKRFKEEDALQLLAVKERILFAKVFTLLPNGHYYTNHYHEDLLKITRTLVDALGQLVQQITTPQESLKSYLLTPNAHSTYTLLAMVKLLQKSITTHTHIILAPTSTEFLPTQLTHIDALRTAVFQSVLYQDLLLSIMPDTMLLFEMEFATIQSRFVIDSNSHYEKAYDWLMAHQKWAEGVLKILDQLQEELH